MCRSPTAHGIFRKWIMDHGLELSVTVDSAGTHDHGANSPPDPRSQEHAARRGYDISDLRARHIRQEDFERADLILVMDWNNLSAIQQLCPSSHQSKVRRLTEFCATPGSVIVPDPYRGEHDDFEYVLDLVEDACEGLIRHLRERHGSSRAGS